MKKAWEKPQLMVLTRGKQEEAVLANCKASSGGTEGANSTDVGCYWLDGEDCMPCSATNPS